MLVHIILFFTHLLAFVGGIATGLFVLYKAGEDLEKKDREKMVMEE